MKFVSLELEECPGISLGIREGKPVLLELRPTAAAYLGAILDGRGGVKQLLEIWVQDFSRALPEIRERVFNPTFERQWDEMVAGLASVAPRDVWRGEWETTGLPVMLLRDQSDQVDRRWSLCRDDALLEKHGLSAYTKSGCRYLVSASEEKFLALCEEAAMGSSVPFADEAWEGWSVFNREGGKAMIRHAAPFDFGGFIDLLGGVSGEGARNLWRIPFAEDEGGSPKGDFLEQAGVGFLHGRSSTAARVAEIFFLKLCSLRGAMGAVADVVKESGLPMGGLQEESFAVRVARTAFGLPFFWTQEVTLRDRSRFVALETGSGVEVHPLAIFPGPSNVYSPPRRVRVTSGMSRLHVKKVTPPDETGSVVVSGILSSDGQLEASRKDLVRLQLPGPEGRHVFLWGALARSRDKGEEWLFASHPVSLPDDFLPGEIGESGVLFEKAAFEIIPSVGPPRDLYSLGVLAVRTLFTAYGGALATRVEDFEGLMRVFGTNASESDWATGAGRLQNFVDGAEGSKWRDLFGSQNIARDVGAQVASDAIPDRLWWSCVEWVCQLFPGKSLGSFASTMEDYDKRAPHLSFEVPLAKLDELIEQARLLIFGDPLVNRDLLKIVESFKRKAT